ncbi:VOC family protein [Jannaschia sp. 2305UL9-9]|uniref:VOC family protein n=1 Tax=Jannaschia sp. 2305UL9-9 TaxID=3121638 RepID=UPI00352783BF
MNIYIMNVFVDDQAKALDFYTRVLGFEVKADAPLGEHRWLTVVSPDEPGGTELLLEPNVHPAVDPFRQALVADGIPAVSFKVDDLDAEVGKLKALDVRFAQEPLDAGPVRMPILDDTCGNFVQLIQMKEG